MSIDVKSLISASASLGSPPISLVSMFLLSSLLLVLFVFQARSDEITRTCTAAQNVQGPGSNWQTTAGNLPATASVIYDETDILRLTGFGFTSSDIPGTQIFLQKMTLFQMVPLSMDFGCGFQHASQEHHTQPSAIQV